MGVDVIGVAILTCDRVNLTKTTVDSFKKWNPKGFSLYYGDDASTNLEMHSLMEKRGVECVVRNKKRIGCSPTTERLLNAVAAKGDLVLLLQNDFQTVRSINLSVVRDIFRNSDVGWVRLFGIHKNDTVRGGNPVNTENRHRSGSPKIKWRPYNIGDEVLEIGDAPWSYNPVIVRSSLVADIMRNANKELDAILNADELGKLTVRFMKNITNHIGIHKSTPGGMFGKSGGSYHKQTKKT